MLLLLAEHPDTVHVTGEMLGLPNEAGGLESYAFPRLGMEEAVNRLEALEGKFFVEKTPSHSFHIEDILKSRLDSRVIFMARSPLEVATSAIHAKFVRDDKVSRAVWYYNETAKSALKVKDSRMMIVRSESLFGNPKSVLSRLLKFCGLRQSEELIESITEKHGEGKQAPFGIYRVGEYTVKGTLVGEQEERVRRSCWDSYEQLLARAAI